MNPDILDLLREEADRKTVKWFQAREAHRIATARLRAAQRADVLALVSRD